MKEKYIGEFSLLQISESFINFKQGKTNVAIAIMLFATVMLVIGVITLVYKEGSWFLLGFLGLFPMAFIAFSFYEFGFHIESLILTKQITFCSKTIYKYESISLTSLVFRIDIVDDSGEISIVLKENEKYLLNFNSVSTADEFCLVINKLNGPMVVKKTTALKNHWLMNMLR